MLTEHQFCSLNAEMGKVVQSDLSYFGVLSCRKVRYMKE